MKNLILVAAVALSATPAFAADTLKGMIEEVEYQAKECGNSVMKSAEMARDNHEAEYEIQTMEMVRQSACDLTKSRRMSVLSDLSADQPKPDVKKGWFHEGTSPKESKRNQVKAEREACVLKAMRKGIEGVIAGEEDAEKIEDNMISDCMRRGSQRLDEILMQD